MGGTDTIDPGPAERTEVFNVTRLVSAELGLDISHVQRAGEGEVNRVYFAQGDDDRQLIIRLQDKSPDIARRQQAVLDRCEEAGVPVPHTIALKTFRKEDMPDARTRSIVVQDRLKGYSLDDRKHGARTEANFWKAGATIANLHNIPANGHGPITFSDQDNPSFTDKIKGFADTEHYKVVHDVIKSFGISEEVLDFALSAAAQRAKLVDQHSGSLLHGDLKPEHIFIGAGKKGDYVSGIIDWDNAAAGDPMYDIVWMRTNSRVSDGELGALLSGYESVRGLGDDVVDRFQVLALDIALSSIAYFGSGKNLAEAKKSSEAHLRWHIENFLRRVEFFRSGSEFDEDTDPIHFYRRNHPAS